MMSNKELRDILLGVPESSIAVNEFLEMLVDEARNVTAI